MPKFLPICCGLIAAVGCASMFLHGGKLVDRDFDADVVVAYEARGTVPPGTRYFLVRTERGEAMLERSSDGSGTVIDNHWREGDADHWFCWVGRRHGYEYVIPIDRSRPGEKYVYPFGYFTTTTIDGSERPQPSVKLEPVATLVPR